MAIILRLDRVMADRKMSLNELSEKVGVSNVNLSKIKTGKISAIRFSTLDAICKALDCQPGDILEYVPEKQLSALALTNADEICYNTYSAETGLFGAVVSLYPQTEEEGGDVYGYCYGSIAYNNSRVDKRDY